MGKLNLDILNALNNYYRAENKDLVLIFVAQYLEFLVDWIRAEKWTAFVIFRKTSKWKMIVKNKLILQ